MAYKCRAYPTAEQATALNRTFGCVRVVWNRTLAWRHQRYDGEQQKTGFTQASAYLTAMKATGDLAWLNEVPSVPLQQAIRHQQAAFTNFFAGRARYPRFKSRTGRQSAEYTRSGFRYRDGALFLAKMGTPLAFTWSWPGTGPASIDPTTVTVSRDPCGRWYVSLAVDVPEPERFPATGAVVGVDFGIKDFAVTSGGQKIPNPRTLAQRERNLARYQRRMVRCQKGSANRAKAKAKAKAARSHRKVRASRADFCTAPPRPWSATRTRARESPSFTAGSSQSVRSSWLAGWLWLAGCWAGGRAGGGGRDGDPRDGGRHLRKRCGRAGSSTRVPKGGSRLRARV